MKSTIEQPALLIDELEALRPLLRDHVPEEVLRARPPGKWSVKQMLGHLADCDRHIYGPRMKALAEASTCAFDPVDAEALNEKGAWNDRATEDVLDEVVKARKSLLDTVDAVSESSWNHVGRFPDGEERTLGDYLELVARHDAHHLSAIAHRLHASGLR